MAASASPSSLDAATLAQLLDVGRSLVAELDIETVLDRVLATAQELTGARYAALGILDEQRRELARFVTRGLERDQRDAIGDPPHGRGILGVLIDEPQPLRLSDVGAHARSYGFPVGHPPMKTFLGVPVMIHGQAWGNLYLTDKQGGDFDEGDVQAVVVLAEWAAVAIDNARLYQRVERRRAELERAVRGFEATSAIAQALGGETELERVLELIVKRARALVEARTMLILLREGDDLVVAAGAGATRPQLGTRIPIASSTSGEALRRGETMLVADARSGLQVSPENLGVPGVDSALLVPLVYRKRAVGVLAAYDHLGETARFDEDDERAMRAFAASAATAVATARTVAEQRLREAIEAAEAERRRWARELHDETLQALGGLRMLLSSARRTGRPEVMERGIDEAIEHVTREIENLRAIIRDLRPASLDELGLVPALRSLSTRVAELNGLAIDARLDEEALGGRLSPHLETTVYRVVQEALTNVVKHARAEHVEIEATVRDGKVSVSICDDGEGFDPDAPSGGFGLTGMRERVQLAGGRLTVRPDASGTTVLFELPLERDV